MEPGQAIQSIENAIHQGRFFHAHNLASEAARAFPDDLRIRQLFGLSMSKSGAKNAALKYLTELYQEHDDPETSGILAGVYKDLFKMTTDTSFALKSLEVYQRNFEKDRSYYTGINAATMNQISGNGRKAKELAGEVIQLLGTPAEDDFWAIATLAESYLLQKKVEEATHYYEKAASLNAGNFGQLNSTFSQLMLLKHFLLVPKQVLQLFEPPGIAAFTGHMIDHNRSTPRFPESIESQVRVALEEQLAKLKIAIGFTSLACGSDILFAETLLESGGEVNVLLPFAKKDFIETSVAFAGDHWVERFEKVLSQSHVHYITEERFFNDDVLFEFLGKVIIGASILRGQLMHTQPYLLSVLSAKDQEKKVGGTRSVIDFWPIKSRHFNINTDLIVEAGGSTSDMAVVNEEAASEDVQREIRYILFADIVGFSKLEEEQTPHFMHLLLTKMSEELKDFPKPNILNTWGDSIFAVYRNAKFAVDFAMKVRAIFTETRWEREGLPKDLNIRIALHAGPVFVGTDPLTQKVNVYGSHVNRAARMEPVAIPGLIYASNQFAAALTAEAPETYALHHVGIIDLAKAYGSQEVYMIEWRNETNF